MEHPAPIKLNLANGAETTEWLRNFLEGKGALFGTRLYGDEPYFDWEILDWNKVEVAFEPEYERLRIQLSPVKMLVIPLEDTAYTTYQRDDQKVVSFAWREHDMNLEAVFVKL